jgi:hypothetical protein
LGVLATAGLQSRTIGVTEPVLLATLGVLNLGAAFYVRKSAAKARHDGQVPGREIRYG